MGKEGLTGGPRLSVLRLAGGVGLLEAQGARALGLASGVEPCWASLLGTGERAGGMGWSEKGKEAGLGWGEEGRRERFGPPGWVWAFYFLSPFLFPLLFYF